MLIPMTARNSVLDDIIITDIYLSVGVASKALFRSLNTLDDIKKYKISDNFTMK